MVQAVQAPPNADLGKPSAAEKRKASDACPPLVVRSFGLTDCGKVRPQNEDQFLIAVLRKALHIESTSLSQARVQYGRDESHLFVVADGMGGHAGGETASALAVDSVGSFVLQTFKWFAGCRCDEEDQVLADFQVALDQANTQVRAQAAEDPHLHGMATTITVAYSLNDELFVAHVGDSRGYLCRQANFYRLTRDHTLVDEMVERGILKPEEAAHHQWRHVVTNAVGGSDPNVRVEVHKVRLEAGDRLLLCSDGLTGMVADEEIGRILQTDQDPEQACRHLVARAKEAGGADNITVVVADFLAAENPSARDPRSTQGA